MKLTYLYKYDFLKGADEEISGKLSALGRQGWRVISSHETPNGGLRVLMEFAKENAGAYSPGTADPEPDS